METKSWKPPSCTTLSWPRRLCLSCTQFIDKSPRERVPRLPNCGEAIYNVAALGNCGEHIPRGSQLVTRGNIKKVGDACQKAPYRLKAKRGPATAAFWPLGCQCPGYSFSIQAPPIPARCTQQDGSRSRPGVSKAA